MKLLPLLFAGFFFLNSLLAQDNNRINTLHKTLDTLIQRNEFNGILLYAVNGKIMVEKAVGTLNLSDKTPIDKFSSFNLASLTKQFIGLLSLKIKEKYPFSPDDSIKKYLPSFPYPDIRIRHLLHHTSGLAEYFDWAENQTGPLDTIRNQEVLTYFIREKPALQFVPGSKYQYCNTGYILMAILLEKITGKDIHELMNQFIERMELNGGLKKEHGKRKSNIQ